MQRNQFTRLRGDTLICANSEISYLSILVQSERSKRFEFVIIEVSDATADRIRLRSERNFIVVPNHGHTIIGDLIKTFVKNQTTDKNT